MGPVRVTRDQKHTDQYVSGYFVTPSRGTEINIELQTDRSVSTAACRAHLATYRIHSAVKNVIPNIQVPFCFPTAGRVQSLSEVCLSMLPAARTPKSKSVPGHFNIEGQASLNDLSFQPILKIGCLCLLVWE